MSCYQYVHGKLKERRAQVLLPAVLLAPIFILVIYLLFETAKVSNTKIRQQFALDNAAYSQTSSLSAYLNAVALTNGPLPYRVMSWYGTDMDPLPPKQSEPGLQPITIFELFYKGGGLPAIGPDYEHGINKPPAAESVDWGLKYYEGDELDEDASRADWEKENPVLPDADKEIPVMSKKLVESYFFPATVDGDSSKGPATAAIIQYLEAYARTGSIYKSQDYAYKEVSRNAFMFREAYYLNAADCKRSDDCARQSASHLRQFLDMNTKPLELDKIKFWISDTGSLSYHGGAYGISFKATELLNGEKLFQFAYLDPASRGRLKNWARGVDLKQPFKLPRNRFNINLEQKYKPYVRNRVIMSCPRSSNNCVWPNPLPKYSVTLEP